MLDHATFGYESNLSQTAPIGGLDGDLRCRAARSDCIAHLSSAGAQVSARANENLENIGARRLVTIVEKVFEQINFDAPEMVCDGQKTVAIRESFVREQVAAIVKDEDLSKFVL